MPDHPSPETLDRLGTEAMGEETFAAIERHVAGCDECLAVLDRLARDDAEDGASGITPDDYPELPGFVIEAELGRGSMGVVYRAVWVELGRTVAIKVVPSGPASGAAERRRWLREARSLSRVARHPHVVQFLCPGEHAGWLYLVLEFVPGGSLEKRLKGPVPPRAAARFLESTARAVDHIHRAGLLHLDIKPTNILVDAPPEAPWDDLVPRVSDFGIARLGDDPGATQTATVGPRGTPRYMAPEQLAEHDGPPGPAADVHALGATLYQMLTDRPPFLAPTVAETLDQVRHQEPVSPRKLVPGIPRDLETICLRCLHKDPSRRYASAADLAADLSRFLDGRPILARPVSPFEHAWRWCRRRPAIAGLAAALGVTLTVGVVGVLVLWRRAEEARQRAESNYQASSQALDGLLNVTWDTSTGPGNSPGRYTAILKAAREKQIRRREQDPSDIGERVRLAKLDLLLGFARNGDGLTVEAHSLWRESFDLIDSIPPTAVPGLNEGRRIQIEAAARILNLLSDPVTLRQDGDSVMYFSRRAERVIGRMNDSIDQADSVFELSEQHGQIAHKFAWIGDSLRSRELLAANGRMLDSLPPAIASTPRVVLRRASNRSASGDEAGGLELVRSAARTESGSRTLRDQIDRCLGEMAARRFGWFGLSDETSEQLAGEEHPEALARRVLSFLRAQASSAGRDPASVARVGWRMSHYQSLASVAQRRAGRLEEARRSVACLHALALQITKSYPDSSPGWLLLSEAHVQRGKLAAQVSDNPSVARELQQALDSARRASALDPEDEEARQLVPDRQRRLDRVAAG